MSNKKYNPDDPFFNGLTIRDMLEVAKLATSDTTDWDCYDLSKLTFGIYQQSPNIRNGFSDYKFAQMNIPFKSKGKEYFGGFELKFFEDGYLSYENGLDVKLRISNPIEGYKILSEKMKDIRKPLPYSDNVKEYQKRYEEVYGKEEV